MKNPVKTAVSNTPNVERTIPGTRIGLISLNLVSIPPETIATENHADDKEQ